MKISDVMTKEVVFIPPTATLQQAVQLMLNNGISGLPVIDKQGTLVGIVTEGDFLRRSELGTQKHRSRWIELLMTPNHLAEEYIHAHARKVADVMTATVYTVDRDAPLEEAVSIMEIKRVKRLPVVHDGCVVGVVSRANLLRGLAALKPTDGGHVDDAGIRSQILDEIEGHLGTIGRYNVVVNNGVVDLWGSVISNRDAVRIAAENVPGVKGVRNHLTWIDPLTGWVIAAGEDSETAEDSSSAVEARATLH